MRKIIQDIERRRKECGVCWIEVCNVAGVTLLEYILMTGSRNVTLHTVDKIGRALSWFENGIEQRNNLKLAA